jgi:hypothetical protein
MRTHLRHGRLKTFAVQKQCLTFDKAVIYPAIALGMTPHGRVAQRTVHPAPWMVRWDWFMTSSG